MSTVATINDRFYVRLAVWVALSLHVLLRRRSMGPVVGLPFNICIKSKWCTQLAEAHAMEFVRQDTSIPVPKVHAAFLKDGQAVIVMQRIPGNQLWQGWHGRSPASRQAILKQLKDYIEQLRTLSRSPEDHSVANVLGGPLYDERFPNTRHLGPFPDVQEFHLSLRNGIKADTGGIDQMPGLPELIAYHDRPGHRSVFTHGDLSTMNIFARGDTITGIIDWETAGWLPEYWEYTSNWHANPHNLFWQDEVGHFITPDPEALNAEIVRRQYFHFLS